MQRQERPETQRDRVFIGFLAGAVLVANGWVVARIAGSAGPGQTLNFLALAGLLTLLAYLGWLHYALATVTFYVQRELLLIRMAGQKLEVPLSQIVHMHRWRRRWMWSDHAERELRVEQVEFMPPSFLGRKERTWVVVYLGARRERQAVALLPSPELLIYLRAWAAEHRSLSG